HIRAQASSAMLEFTLQSDQAAQDRRHQESKNRAADNPARYFTAHQISQVMPVHANVPCLLFRMAGFYHSGNLPLDYPADYRTRYRTARGCPDTWTSTSSRRCRSLTACQTGSPSNARI